MTRLFLFFFVSLLLFSSCADNHFIYKTTYTAPLKDNSVLSFDLEATVENKEGLDELDHKREKLEHAVRIMMVLRYPSQVNNTLRIKSLLRKIFNSQLEAEVTGITVKNIHIEK